MRKANYFQFIALYQNLFFFFFPTSFCWEKETLESFCSAFSPNRYNKNTFGDPGRLFWCHTKTFHSRPFFEWHVLKIFFKYCISTFLDPRTAPIHDKAKEDIDFLSSLLPRQTLGCVYSPMGRRRPVCACLVPLHRGPTHLVVCLRQYQQGTLRK